uniref:Putative capsid protein n=1 Tax=viral metagenome TaxID=1070528 RepID=A0A6M3KSY9_9ZZZZ
MAYPVAAGVTSMSGQYIPEIWSLKTLIKFYTATVFGEIANTDYEGEISKQGDKVQIRVIPDITIRDYQIGQKLVRERPATSKVTLLVDKGKYYSISVNLVEMKQADIAYVEKWTDDAGEQLKISIDSNILSNVYSDASAYNSGATAGYRTSSYDMGVSTAPVGLDKDNVIDFIVDMGSVLDEQDVPETGRWLVLPPMLCGMIKKSDLKDASMTGDAVSPVRNGRLGMIDRFTLYKSNQIATTADGSGQTAYNIIAGNKNAITFASQLTDQRTIPNPDDFGDLMEGLQVYGYKVIKAEALVHGYVYKV